MPGRSRGRPRSFDPQVALQGITDVFWTKGFAAASLDDLTAATRLNRPNLYGAFGDKAGMYREALTAVSGVMRKGLEGALSVDQPLRARLESFFRNAVAIYTAGGDARGCIVMCTAPGESAEDPGVRAILAATIDSLDQAFSEALATDGIAAAATRGRALTSLLQGLAIRARAGVQAAALLDGMSEQLDLILGPAPTPRSAG